MTNHRLATRATDVRPAFRRPVVDTSTIAGWGVDADPRNDPTYPYRDRSADDHNGTWQRPAQQLSSAEILLSVEHKQRPAVFGTASPPKWVSGAIRRIAFRWSESNWMHWLLLTGADRVNMVEGLVEDVARAKIPNIPKEMGVPAEWKHNRSGFVKKLAVVAVIGGVSFALTNARRGDKGRSDKG